MKSIEEILKKKLSCDALMLEGIEAIGVKPFWNRQSCIYSEICIFREHVEKYWRYSKPKPCLFNPKMFKCPAYQYYQLISWTPKPLLLCERNS